MASPSISPMPGPGGAAAAQLPPLPNLSASPGAGGQGGAPSDQMSMLLSGIAPIKAATDTIMGACKSIVQSGSIPGAESVCGQIVALAQSLLPMAVQSSMQVAGGGQGAPPPGGPPPPPSGGPQPILGGVGPQGQ